MKALALLGRLDPTNRDTVAQPKHSWGSAHETLNDPSSEALSCSFDPSRRTEAIHYILLTPVRYEDRKNPA